MKIDYKTYFESMDANLNNKAFNYAESSIVCFEMTRSSVHSIIDIQKKIDKHSGKVSIAKDAD